MAAIKQLDIPGAEWKGFNTLKTQAELDKPQENLPKKDHDPTACPTCQTPGHISGVECPGCGFKEWLIREMAMVVLPEPQAKKVGFDGMDMRFEDYPARTEQEQELKQNLMSLSPPPFYAKFPFSNSVLHWDGKGYSIRIGLPAKTKAKFLPDYWWDYAAVYWGDYLIKPPKIKRGTSDKRNW
jgi:hypothetical protein